MICIVVFPHTPHLVIISWPDNQQNMENIFSKEILTRSHPPLSTWPLKCLSTAFPLQTCADNMMTTLDQHFDYRSGKKFAQYFFSLLTVGIISSDLSSELQYCNCSRRVYRRMYRRTFRRMCRRMYMRVYRRMYCLRQTE